MRSNAIGGIAVVCLAGAILACGGAGNSGTTGTSSTSSSGSTTVGSFSTTISKVSSSVQNDVFTARMRLEKRSGSAQIPVAEKQLVATSTLFGGSQSTTDANGEALFTFDLTKIAVGTSTGVNIEFAADPSAQLNRSTFPLDVARPVNPPANSVLAISGGNTSGEYGGGWSLSARLTRSGGSPLSSETVVLRLGSENFSAQTDSGGNVSFSGPFPAAVGQVLGSASFAGNGQVNGDSVPVSLSIQKARTNLDFGFETLVETGSEYNLANGLRNANNGETLAANLTLTTPFYTGSLTSNSNRVFDMGALTPGNYVARLDFAGDSLHNPSSLQHAFEVRKGPPTVSGANFNITRGQTGQPSFALRTRTGQAIASRKLILTMPSNATVYEATTNSTGFARFSIPTTSNWSRGSRSVTIEFAGDSVFRSGSLSVTMTIQ